MSVREFWSCAVRLGVGAVVMCVVGLALAVPAMADNPIATTTLGPVQGVATTSMTKFLGIPYAAPPVGALRWTPPQAHAPWMTPIDASAFGPHCAQSTSPFGQVSSSEDCLYLNVYVPVHKGFALDIHRLKPVMVWIHGGAFQVGESDDYDPTRLVTQGDVVMVTINYRIGALGFMAHPALSAESGQGISGNYGILDQQAALQWVHANIKAFGGNPKKVTIFGESAGGASVHAQLASPAAAGLFQGAIVESGALFTQPTLTDAESLGSSLATTVGCSDQTAACLRAVSVADLLAAQGTNLTSSSPNIDGVVLPEPLRAAFVAGHFNRVPVIEGSNHDEFRLFVALLIEIPNGPLTAGQYENAIATVLSVPPSVASILAARYPVANYPSPGIALGTLATDAAFSCNARHADDLLSRYVKTYAYEFNDQNAPELFLPPVSFSYGAAHASEIQYLFDVPNQTMAPALTADQQTLAATMVKYWTKFARSKKPKVSKVPKWHLYQPADLTSERMLSLVAPTPTDEFGINFGADHQCAFWDPLIGN
ncbi:MAG TPA: carboxylesterase family protein [Candidatus Binatia bacterium]|jgi:para-nitrobenzyl esterase